MNIDGGTKGTPWKLDWQCAMWFQKKISVVFLLTIPILLLPKVALFVRVSAHQSSGACLMLLMSNRNVTRRIKDHHWWPSGRQISDWSQQLDLKKTEMRKIRSMGLLSKSVLWSSFRLSAHLTKLERRLGWLRSLQHLDPRFQILLYFEEVALHGGAFADPLAPPPSIALLRGFAKAAAFTVWRPTSREAICKMMRGEVTGNRQRLGHESEICQVWQAVWPRPLSSDP